ncbi:MAG TPA: NADH-quinone oxidoreductase subunit K [Beutenbergiaceae bacterium]|nr:NADH-quinone oxidoreductase subunit K [Beutenbergiaceae bacterium]
MSDVVLLQLLLTVAAALVGVGVYGALSQQSIVMVMMGIELIVNGVLVGAVSAWYFLTPEAPDPQILIVLALVVMAVEMVMGFAATLAIYRARKVDMVDSATDLKG